MLENLNDTERFFSRLFALEYFFLKVSSADLLNSGLLIDLFGLIEVMQFTIEVFFNQLVQVLADLIEVYELSVFVHI